MDHSHFPLICVETEVYRSDEQTTVRERERESVCVSERERERGREGGGGIEGEN